MRVIVALLVGAALFVVARWALTWVWSRANVTWGADDPPLRADQRVAAMTTLLLSVLVSARATAAIARDRAQAALVALSVVGVLAGGYALVLHGPTAIPLWYRAILVAMVPAGAYLAWLVEEGPGESA
jgi:hypothetical protein